MGVYINKNRSANRVDGAAGPALSIAYNNTESGLNAENVQGAIDEVQGEVTELNSNISNLKSASSTTETITSPYTVTDTHGLLLYTLFATNAVYSGARCYVNSIEIAAVDNNDSVASIAGIGIKGSFHVFKGDVITFSANSQGGNVICRIVK